MKTLKGNLPNDYGEQYPPRRNMHSKTVCGLKSTKFMLKFKDSVIADIRNNRNNQNNQNKSLHSNKTLKTVSLGVH